MERKRYNIGIIVSCFIALLSFFSELYKLIHYGVGENIYNFFSEICILFSSLSVLFYALYGYKIKGNILKSVMFFFAATLIIKLVGVYQSSFSLYLIGAASVLIGFIAGRLDRNKELSIIGLIVFILLILFSFLIQFNITIVDGSASYEFKIIWANVDSGNVCPLSYLFELVSLFNVALIWLSLCLSYLFRYKEHKSLK